jgi:hypothetical protein
MITSPEDLARGVLASIDKRGWIPYAGCTTDGPRCVAQHAGVVSGHSFMEVTQRRTIYDAFEARVFELTGKDIITWNDHATEADVKRILTQIAEGS